MAKTFNYGSSETIRGCGSLEWNGGHGMLDELFDLNVLILKSAIRDSDFDLRSYIRAYLYLYIN